MQRPLSGDACEGRAAAGAARLKGRGRILGGMVRKAMWDQAGLYHTPTFLQVLVNEC